MSIFVILGLLVCIKAQGSSAVTPVFVQKGDDVMLNLKEADDLEDSVVSWNFNNKSINKDLILVRWLPRTEPQVSPGYRRRIEFTVKRCCVKLKNLQETDSGVYTARVIGAVDEQTTQYNVTVQGSSAVTPVFVQKGDDVMLNLTEADDLEDSIVFWKVKNTSSNKESVLVRWLPRTEPQVSSGYKGRIEFTVKKYCVKLKNLQETDSGVYTAKVMRTFDFETKAEYNVTVQDPVSPVKLTVDSVSSSSDSCNLTVTCSTQDSHISSTFTCDNKTCSQEGGERSEVTTSAASLRVYLVNDSITCNHSNQVSWTEDVTKTQDFCPRRHGSECVSAGISVCLLKTVLFSIGLIIMVSAVISVHVMVKFKKQD